MSQGRQEEVDTPQGVARVHHFEAASPRGLLVLGHGAGGGVAAGDLQALAAALPSAGVRVALVEQPWRVAGRRVAEAPARLDRAWTAVLAGPAFAAARAAKVPLLVGGRSAGARVACRTAAQVGAVAVVALAFPLHPPGRPERSRRDELTNVSVPILVVQGAADPFGRPEEVEDALGADRRSGSAVVTALPGNHTLDRDPAGLVRAVEAFLGQVLPAD